MKTLLLGATALAASAFLITQPSNAALIASFSQDASGATVTATDNGTTTNINVTNASTTVSSFNGGVLGSAIFNLNATSNDAAQTVGGAVIQHYDGGFCFTSAAGCTGTNYLSGVFSDAAFGALGGPGLVVNVNNPPDTLTLTSDVIDASDLAAPNSFSLSFADLSPLLHINGTTIAGFTAGFAGTVSASSTETPVPEPMTLGLFGLGLLGLGLVRSRKAN